MASPNAVFTEIVTTTLREHKRQLSDNMSNNNALWARMNQRGNIDLIDGGYEIALPLDYAENATYQRYSGFDVLNIQASDVFTAAAFPWRQSAVHVVASGLELRANAGRNRIIALAESRIQNAMRTMGNNLSQDLYSDGSLPNQMNGLQALVSDTGTGTVGGIDSSTFTFWQNVVQNATAPLQGGGAITPSASTIQTLMLPLWLELTRQGDRPDLIPSSNDYFTFYEESLTDLKRYQDVDSATGGFISLKYKTADVIFDGGSKGGGIPNEHMYFLNTEYLKLCVHQDANIDQGSEKMSVNQDAVVIPVIWQGNLCVSNRSLQGVLIDQ